MADLERVLTCALANFSKKLFENFKKVPSTWGKQSLTLVGLGFFALELPLKIKRNDIMVLSLAFIELSEFPFPFYFALIFCRV